MFPKQSVNTPTNIVTTGSNILMGNGSGGVGNVTIGANLTFTGGTLTATGGGSTGTMPPGWVNVMDYGAVGNAYAATPHDDTAAFLAALATGNNVWVPINDAIGNYLNYRISSTLTPGVGQGIMGSGRPMTDAVVYPRLLGNLKGVINFTGTNIPCIQLSNYGAWCENLAVIQNYQNLAVSGNSHFSIGAPTGSTIPQLTVRKCFSTGAWYGFDLHGQHSDTIVENCFTARANAAGFRVSMSAPFGSYYLNNCFDQASPQINAASPFYHPYAAWSLLVENTDTANINNFYGQSVKLGSEGSGTSVHQLNIRGLNIESFAGNTLPALTIGSSNPYSGGTVTNCSISDLEILTFPTAIGDTTNNLTAEDNLYSSSTLVGQAGYPLFVGYNVIDQKILGANIFGCRLVDYGVNNTFDNLAFDERGHYCQATLTSLYGTGGSLTNSKYWNFVKAIRTQPNASIGIPLQGYTISNNKGFNYGYGTIVSTGIEVVSDYGIIGLNDFGWCNTPLVKPSASLNGGLYRSLGRGNTGSTDWGGV